jgi:hypothetical protein
VKYAVIKEREGVGVQNEEKVIRDITVNNCSFGSHTSGSQLPVLSPIREALQLGWRSG